MPVGFRAARSSALLLFALIVGTGHRVLSAPQPAHTLQHKRMQAAVVRVRREDAQGSGVVVSIPPCGTFILTAAHIVAFGAGPIVIESGSSPVRHWAVARVSLPLDPDLDLSLLTAPGRLQHVALPLVSDAATTPGPQGDHAFSRGVAIGYPAGLADSQILLGHSLPRLVMPLHGGYDLPLRLRLHPGMSGGLFAHVGVWGIQGILALHADPVWPYDLTYNDGSPVPESLQQEYDRLSFAISASQILEHLRPLLVRHPICQSSAWDFEHDAVTRVRVARGSGLQRRAL